MSPPSDLNDIHQIFTRASPREDRKFAAAPAFEWRRGP
jgi:hypothetical protein